MENLRPPINPFVSYDPKQAAKITGIGQPTIYKALKSGELASKEVGKGYKILGENLLRYLGSVTYQAPSQPITSDPGGPLTSKGKENGS